MDELPSSQGNPNRNAASVSSREIPMSPVNPDVDDQSVDDGLDPSHYSTPAVLDDGGDYPFLSAPHRIHGFLDDLMALRIRVMLVDPDFDDAPLRVIEEREFRALFMRAVIRYIEHQGIDIPVHTHIVWVSTSGHPRVVWYYPTLPAQRVLRLSDQLLSGRESRSPARQLQLALVLVTATVMLSLAMYFGRSSIVDAFATRPP
ncbi:hypothetical protein C8Q76DRAFT_795960 [Earliella scabrosa]|nr:hypothetical protein C8Q76DRAFT_795960 [Earliella scabrosa]